VTDGSRNGVSLDSNVFGADPPMAGNDAMKQDILWWQVIALIILVTGGVLTVWSAQQQDRSLRDELLIKTSIAGTGVSVEQVTAMTGSAADIALPEYQVLKDQLGKIRAADPKIRFVYLVGQRKDGTIIFLADSESPESADYSPPGQVYTEAPAALFSVFRTGGMVNEGPYTDRWGTWVSGFIPVIDPATGRVIAVFGMDVDARNWNFIIAQDCAAIIAASLLILVLVITFGLTQQRSRKEQRRLEASEEKFSRAFNANPALMAVTTRAEGRILDINTSFLETVGYSREEVIGRTVLDLNLYSDPSQRHVIISRLRESEPVRDVDVKITKKNRDTLDGLFSAITIDADGIPCLLTVLRDITERKVAEEELKTANRKIRQSKDKFRAFIDHSYDALFIHDTEGKVLDVNATMLRLYRVTYDDALRYTIADFTGPANRMEEAREHWERVLAGEDQFFPWQARRPNDGSVFDVEVYLTRIIIDDVPMILGNIRDITERKLAESTLQRVNKKLNILSQLTRRDLTNQVFVLNSYMNLTKNQLTGQDKIIETLQKGILEIRSIQETINYSKDYQDMGEKPPRWQNVRMVFLFGLSHLSTGEIRHNLETEDLEIFADPLLEKVCQRLFENSVKHGGHVTSFRVWHTVTPEVATIFFEDDGIGIPQEKKEHIFVRDESVGHASIRSLIFVKEILDITGITIRETGEPGKGVRFEMTVPHGAWRVTKRE
jgi:PAS domain S-box-containing protein